MEQPTESFHFMQKMGSFVDEHPRIIIGIVVVIIMFIIFYYLRSNGWFTKMGFKSRKSGGKMSPDEELNYLIESIHDKQK